MARFEAAGGPGWPNPKRRRDPLVGYVLYHWLLGMLFGALCATLLLIFDPLGLRPLMHDSGLAAEAIFLLYIGFMTSFGGLVCAAAVMVLPRDDEPPRGGLRGEATPSKLSLQLAYVRAAKRV